jgi:hypothetical protein
MSAEGEPPHPSPTYRSWTVDSSTQLGNVRAQLRWQAIAWALPEECTDRLLMVAMSW